MKKFSFSELIIKILNKYGGGASSRKRNKDERKMKYKMRYTKKLINRKAINKVHKNTKSNDNNTNILKESLKFYNAYVLLIPLVTSLLVYFFSNKYEDLYGIPALYFYDLDIKNISICIFCVVIINFILFYINPYESYKDKNKKNNWNTLLLFAIISLLNAASIVSILLPILGFNNRILIFIISFIIFVISFCLTYTKNFEFYQIISLLTTAIVITAIIITSGHANPFYKSFELLDFPEDNYPIDEDQSESLQSWRLLKDRVVIGHYKNKLIVMDGLVKDNDLVVLKPGYKLIDGSNAKIASEMFATHEIKNKDYFYPDINRTQKINDHIIKRNKVLKLNTNEVYSEELSITSNDYEKDKINNNLNKLVCKVVSSGNFIFSDINVLENGSEKKLDDEDFNIIKNDRGFSVSLNEGGIDKLYNTTEGLAIRYRARLGSNLRDDEYNFIATYFDYGFNEQDLWNNGSGNSKDGKITLSVKFNENQERSNNIVNSIYTLQEKSSDGWKDVSFITSDSLNDFDYTFSGLDDKKLYRIQTIHADNYISDYFAIQDGKANIVNIRNEDDFVKNKVSIQRFNMDKKGGDIVNLGV